MLTKDVLKAIRAHRGAVMVPLTAKDDVFYIQVVKSDLLGALKNVADWQVECDVKNEILYVERCDSSGSED